MKEHAKKALKHDFEVAGKTIPTLAVVALLFVGTGSAALLSSFGTVSGTADVDQAVNVDGPTSVSYDATMTAGATKVNTFDVSNDADVSASVDYTTNCVYKEDSGISTGDVQGDSLDCTGVTRKAVNYFGDAGHDFSGSYSHDTADITVDPDNTGSDDTYKTIQKAVNNAANGDVIVVTDGTYDEDVDVNESVTLVADNPRGATVDGFSIKTSGATVKGFKLTGFDTPVGDRSGIRVLASDATVRSNTITNVDQSSRDRHGIHVYDAGSNIEVSNNLIDGVKNTDGGGAYGVLVQAESNSVDVSYNTIRNVESPSGWAGAISASPSDSGSGSPGSLSLTYNDVGSVGGSSQYPGVCFYNDFINEGDASTITIESNNFNGCPIDLQNKDSDKTMDGTSNWFGTDGIVLDEAKGDIDASYKEVTSETLSAGETETVGIYTNFDVALAPGNYAVDFNVQPSSATSE